MKGKPVKWMGMKPKEKKAEEEAPLGYIAIGSAMAMRGGQKIPIAGGKGKAAVRLEDGDRIVTARGCVANLTGGNEKPAEDNPEYLSITIYPESEARITVRKSTEDGVARQRLASVELVKGLFSVALKTDGRIEDKMAIPSDYPQLEFKPMFGEFHTHKSLNAYVELAGNGTLVLFSFLGRVVHKKSGVEAGGAMAGDVKITATRDAVYSTILAKHPDARIAAVRANAIPLFSSALALGTLGGAEKKKWSVPAIVRKQNREGLIAEAKERLEAAKESGDESLIEAAKQQLKGAESCLDKAGIIAEMKKTIKEMTEEGRGEANIELANLQLCAAEASEDGMGEIDGETLTAFKQKYEGKMMNDAAQSAERALSPLPSYASPDEEEKIVRKDVKRSAKSYGMMMDELADREAGLKEKYMKGKPTAAQALAYEMGGMKARQQMQDDLKAAAMNKGLAATTASAEIGQSLKYRNLDYEILRAEKGTEIRFAKSPQGKEFLLVHIRVSNNTKSDAYLDPDNAFGIAMGAEQVASRNYEIKTDIAPGAKNEGFVMFVVPQDAKSFVFQLGMKNEKKLTVDFKL